LKSRLAVAVMLVGEPAFSQQAAVPEPKPIEVEVRGTWLSPRGLGDVTLNRAVLDASPRQQTPELLSAAPGFFVDHDNDEGLGNDVYLRGFDLEHGSGIEMGVGNVAVNQPIHIQGQGYTDVNFIIPELVDSVHVLAGTYDPRQGDAAIVGSAFFNLAMRERGYHAAASYGSFNHARLLGIAAPSELSDETFAAVAVRRTDGFGARRASESGSLNAQLGVDVGSADHLRLLGILYAARADLPGVLREDHVAAGRIGYYDSYAFLAENQAVEAGRGLVSGEWQHTASEGRFDLALWAMRTDFLARQNFTGAFETSQIDPSLSGLGDLYERINDETAVGVRSSWKTLPVTPIRGVRVVTEPGVSFRLGRTEQARNLLVPATLRVWDRRTDAKVTTLDAAAYLDLDVQLSERLRLSGGPRLDVLSVSVDDQLASEESGPTGRHRTATGPAFSPRVTAEYAVTEHFAVSTSYGEGFRSLDAASLEDGAERPYSKVRSVEAGMRADDGRRRYRTTLAMFNTWVENELVFVANTGGFETQSRSTRRGVVGSFLARPERWVLASTALSVTEAIFETNVPNISHHVPSVPPLLLRTDITARGEIATFDEKPLTGRIGVGYTLLSPRHLTDTIRTPASHILNAGVGLRYSSFELELDGYNVLDLQYADSAEHYVSNWSFLPGQQPASFATHLTAAPPLTVIATLGVHL
jgi:outer membrane receptor protein involved in Fe transport